MDSNAEKEIKALEQEIDAQKVAFEKMASQLPVFTETISFTTKRNEVTLTPIDQPEYAYTTDGNERVQVTFATESGANTIAVLEIDSDNEDTIDFVIERIPYAGGARWIITAVPRYDSSWNRIDTHYTFRVHSIMEGTLEARMIWE